MERIVFFDGVCNLCNAFVNFLITRDSKARLSFAPLQGQTARERIAESLLPEGTRNAESLVYFEGGRAWSHSSGVLRAVAALGWPWRAVLVFWLVPKSWRDRVYVGVASNRFAWFGKKQACRLPTREEASRFRS